ncbi:unnamed protein product [Leptosia nina]|uniref:Uncharacterized protein n=1 Tax=Leptosia nina TaxID=320188 RepID=A0AAV1J357_9NEOP
MAGVSTSGSGATSPRRQRYNRASTTSVTQLLSDGYSSIINRLTRRGPSEKNDALVDSKLTTARTRYDDNMLSNKHPALANVRRYENNRHVSPYKSYSTGLSTASKKLTDDRTYNYLGATKTRINASPLHASSGFSALGRTDSFRRAHVKDKSSPLVQRYPLKETNNNNIDSKIMLGSTRTRLEDKYSSVLDKIAVMKKEKARREKEDREKTLEPEPSVSRGLMRSFTTAVFGESSFKRHYNYSREKTRDKTPYRNTTDRRLSSHKQTDRNDLKNGYDLDNRDRSHFGKDRNSIYRKHQRRSLRAEKSENDRKATKLSLRPVDISLQSGVRDLISPPQQMNVDSKMNIAKTPASSPIKDIGRQKQIYYPSSDEDDDKTPVGDQILNDRETRRKEIQSLIMKYAHLDEVYGRITDKESNGLTTAPAAIKKPEPISVGDVVTLPPELRSRQRAQRPRHLMRQAATPPVSTS